MRDDDEPVNVEAAVVPVADAAGPTTHDDDVRRRALEQMRSMWRHAVEAAQRVGASWDDGRAFVDSGESAEPLPEETCAFLASNDAAHR